MNSATLSAPAKTKRKKLLRKVSLKFFQDDANGEWGLAHSDTISGPSGSDGFNAFWDGTGLFHDVFEHAHEHTDKHFKGWFSMNIGGEVAAMGALWFYYSTCGMFNRLNTSYHSPDEITLSSTCDMMKEAISEGYSNFGDKLESNVPTQKETDNTGLEWIIQEHFDRIQATYPNGHDESDRERGSEYKASVTLEKLQNLYRYGYRMAEKLIGEEGSWNGDVLVTFKSFWDDFCKKHRAEELATRFKGIDFSIYRNAEGLIEWKAEFTPHYGDTEFMPLSIKVQNRERPEIYGELYF